MILEQPLLTERLILRSLGSADADGAYLCWMNDPAVTTFLESRFRGFSTQDLETFIRVCNDNPDVLLLGLFLRADNSHIGNLKVGPIDRHHRFGDMGIAIGDRNAWGKGYGREAIAAVVDHAFRAIGLHKITAGIYASNVGSHRSFLAAGFVEEGRRRDHYRIDDRWDDAILMGRIAPKT